MTDGEPYCEDCDETGWLPNDTGEYKDDWLYKRCPSCRERRGDDAALAASSGDTRCSWNFFGAQCEWPADHEPANIHNIAGHTIEETYPE